MGYVRAAVLVVLAIGCGKQYPHSGPNRGTEIGVWVYDTFPPEGGEGPVRFRLSHTELERVNATMPDVAGADEYADKCGVPQFGIELYERGATTPFAKGHFFHGPDQLMLDFTTRGSARLRGTHAFHDALVAVIKQRGYLNDAR